MGNERIRGNKHKAGGYQGGIVFWAYVIEQLNSLECGFGKLEGRRKSMFPGHQGIKRLMGNWRGTSCLKQNPLWCSPLRSLEK